MKITGVIPARYGSTRFPGKPLALIKGKPLVICVWERARLARNLSEVVIATDDERIFSVVKSFGAKVEMTSSSCGSGTERVCEIAERYVDSEAFINIQGDEPLISPVTIDAVASVFIEDKDKVVDCATAVFPTTKNNSDGIMSPDTAKVVVDKDDFALYFSRAPIPAPARHSAVSPDKIVYLKHIGIYGYRREFLVKKMKTLSPSLYEKIEQLEQLRFLWNGIKIKCVKAASDSIGVDSPDDIPEIEKLLSS